MEDEEGELEVDRFNTKRWFDKKNRYHRLNGPAIIYSNGDKSWYNHGLLHREDGPAREWRHAVDLLDWRKYGKAYEPSAHEIMVWKMKQKKKA